MREAVHIKTGKYYAVKVIQKALMVGREHMVRSGGVGLAERRGEPR